MYIYVVREQWPAYPQRTSTSAGTRSIDNKNVSTWLSFNLL